MRCLMPDCQTMWHMNPTGALYANMAASQARIIQHLNWWAFVFLVFMVLLAIVDFRCAW